MREEEDAADLLAEIRAAHPSLRVALAADARIAAMFRGERFEFRSRLDTALQILRLAVVSDGFLGQALYRAKARLQGVGVPLLPWLFHRAAIMVSQVAVGAPVVMQPGVYLVHGQVVIDGFVTVESDVVIAPFVTIGLRAGDLRGPRIERGATIGTGARVIGPVTVGAGATVGANAVVVKDIPPGATVAGVPAEPIGERNGVAVKPLRGR